MGKRGCKIQVHRPTGGCASGPQQQCDPCSDGIIEAENGDGELFGFERTAETIGKGCSRDLSAPQLLDYLIDEVKAFAGETPQGDDQTVVVLAVEA